MSKIDTDIKQAEKTVGNLGHIQRLADAMMPNPKDWEYRDEIEEGENARCACGHPIRWMFPIHRKSDNAVLAIGSVCIENSIPYLIANGAEGLALALEKGNARLAEMIKERQRRIRETQGNNRYAFLATYAEELCDWITATISAMTVEAKSRGYRKPFVAEYFFRGEFCTLIQEPTASTPGRAAASLEKRIIKGLEYSAILCRQLRDGPYRNIVTPMPFCLEDFKTLAEGFKTAQKYNIPKADTQTAERVQKDIDDQWPDGWEQQREDEEQETLAALKQHSRGP